MKKNLRPLLILAVPVCGIVASLLQAWFFSTTDAKGLPAAGHISQILVWILTATVAAFLGWLTRPFLQAPKYSFNFPASVIAAIGMILAAFGILSTAVTQLLGGGDTLGKVTAWIGIVSAGALALSGYSRWTGKQPNVLTHCVTALYFLMLLVSQYRMWSAEPQLQLYCFQVLASVCLMIATYQRACFDGDMGHRRSYAFFRLAGCYCCLAALPGSEFFLLYLTAGIWCLTDLCNLTPMPQEGR